MGLKRRQKPRFNSYWSKESVISDLTCKNFPSEELDLLFLPLKTRMTTARQRMDRRVGGQFPKVLSQFTDAKVSVLLKFHWKDLDVISASERSYLNARVRQEVCLLGIDEVLFFDDFIDKKYRKWPVEIFLKVINIRQVLGAFTGAMYVASGMGLMLKAIANLSSLG